MVAIAVLGLAFMTSIEVSMYGFPDGHVTEYEKAVDGPLTIIAWVEAGFGVLLLALALRRSALGRAPSDCSAP
jgi:hypothetical protein